MSIVRSGDWGLLEGSDIVPFPLAVEIRYPSEGWSVDLIVMIELSGGGYSAVTLGEFTRPYDVGADGQRDMSPEAADAVAQDAIRYFAHRLRDVLRLDQPSA